MGFPSFFEDIMSRSIENGVELSAMIPSYDPFRDSDGAESGEARAIDAKPKVKRLQGEEARKYFLQHFVGGKYFAYLHVVEAKTGRLLQEYPYRLLKEVEDRIAEVEAKYPGLLRLEIVKRLELPEGSERDPFVAFVVENQYSGLTVTIQCRK